MGLIPRRRNRSGGTGVRGVGSEQAENVAGVRGLGKTGVWGSSSAAGRSGVYGQHLGEGYGVVGDGGGRGNAGILGRNPTGDGVRGEGFNGVVGTSSAMGAGSAGFAPAGVLGRSSRGPGVRGKGNYGGEFEGASAQLRLAPGSTAGHPTTGDHTIGEIYMDSEAMLWVCTADGTPGTWSKVTTTVS